MTKKYVFEISTQRLKTCKMLQESFWKFFLKINKIWSQLLCVQKVLNCCVDTKTTILKLKIATFLKS